LSVAFFQDPPRLGNQYDDDELVQEYAARVLPADVLEVVKPEFREIGELAGGRLFELQMADRLSEPRFVPYDAWGRRVDRVETTASWAEAKNVATSFGLVAAGYERRFGALARVHQFLLDYLVEPSLDVYSCPLAMTDGAARTLLELGSRELIDQVVPRLISRNPDYAWTSGQWMTERTGGSDVGASEAVARAGEDGWRLWGSKWFTSSVGSEVALTLARPEGNPGGGSGLALFFVQLRNPDGSLNNIRVNRLKDKLGTRKVPTAEIELEGAVAVPVAGTRDGVKNITPMLNTTRIWNTVSAVAGMRRALALACDYARRRWQFGAPLAEKPLHADTLAGMQAEYEGAFALAFHAIELFGRADAGVADEFEKQAFRMLTPVVKLTTGKQAVAVASEAVEAFGGAGYVEDTGLPRLLRDAQVLPIWEGTTNVLSLDLLRVVKNEPGLPAEVGRRLLAGGVADRVAGAAAAATAALEHAEQWLLKAAQQPYHLEAGARRYALTVGRALELAALARHASWCLHNGFGNRSGAAVRRLAAHGVDLIVDHAESAEWLLGRRD
jgi:alkylation response protein AidB-like acyl-CoA dehydrogenase